MKIRAASEVGIQVNHVQLPSEVRTCIVIILSTITNLMCPLGDRKWSGGYYSQTKLWFKCSRYSSSVATRFCSAYRLSSVYQCHCSGESKLLVQFLVLAIYTCLLIGCWWFNGYKCWSFVTRGPMLYYCLYTLGMCRTHKIFWCGYSWKKGCCHWEKQDCGWLWMFYLTVIMR